jgi:hypothetical protein
MGISHGGIREQQLLLLQDPLWLSGFGSLFIQQLLQPGAQHAGLRLEESGAYRTGWRSAFGFATWISAIYRRTRVARSRESTMSNSSGVLVDEFRVNSLPATRRSGWARILVRKGILVLTPRIRTSLMARVALRQAHPWKLLIPGLVIFTSSES